MNVLMITPYLPYPLWSGGQIRTYNLLKHLSRRHNITLFSFIRHEKEKVYIKYLKDYCKEVQVFLKRPPWSFTSLSLASVTYYPLVVCMYLSSHVKSLIESSIVRNNFDLIHAETFYIVPNIPKNKIPIILVEQTIEYLVYKHFTETVENPIKKALMGVDVAKIKYWEKRFWQKASKVVAMSKSDSEIMHSMVENLSVDIVPNGVDTDFFQMKRKRISKEKTILFVGNFKWLQNREAVAILTSEIWPKIIKSEKNVKLWIVGMFPTPEIKKMSSSHIKISDDIKDIRQAYYESDILLAPIYGPGGTRYKILESMACGLPVVTTPIGIEGLGVKNFDQALIAESSDSLAKSTVKLLNSPTLYENLVVNGRKLVEKSYTWDKISKTLDHLYSQAVN
jgi:glycosyltransferase involved in cell wall biosynthesis